MTSHFFDLIDGAISILCLLFPAVELIFKKEKQGIHKISKVGWALFILAILMGTNSFLKMKATASEAKHQDSIRVADKTEIIDSIKKNGRDTIKEITQNAKTVYSTDSLDYYGVPFVQITNFNVKYNSRKDSIFYSITFYNLSHIITYHFNWSAISVFKANGNYFHIYPTRMNDNDILAPQKGFVYPLNGKNYNLGIIPDTVYLYVHYTYSNYYKRNTQSTTKVLLWVAKENEWTIAGWKLFSEISDEIKKPLN